ncbi:MAG: NAD(P)H-hydrate epimerase, partial [Bacteroidota bacterium]
MKILSSEEIRNADAYTIKHEPIKSINLMERASKACANWLAQAPILKGGKTEIKFFCGVGNNGGDGLAIARLLSQKKFKIEVFIIRCSDKCSKDFLINEKRLKKIKKVKIHTITSPEQIPHLTTHISHLVIIDSLLGTGLNKPVEGLASHVINHINKSKCFVVAIDIPSGLFSENNFYGEKNPIVRATHTLTFQSPKLAFMFPENGKYIGDFSVLNIGLDEEFISSLPSTFFFITEQDARLILKSRNKFSHKGTFGHALIVAGSFGKMG